MSYTKFSNHTALGDGDDDEGRLSDEGGMWGKGMESTQDKLQRSSHELGNRSFYLQFHLGYACF